MFLNSVLLLVLYFDPFKKFRTPGTVLVANLALSDALTGLIITLRMVFFLTGIYHSEGLIFMVFFYYSTLSTVQVSLLTVLFITWERLFAVAFPIRFKLQVTKLRMFLLSIGAWALSTLLVNLSTFIGEDRFKPVTFLTSASLNFVLMCLIITGYCGIYKLLKRKEQEMGRYGAPCGTPENHIGSVKRKQNSLIENRRLIKTFRVITIILLITVLPIMVLTSVAASCPVECAITALKIYFKYEPISLINFTVNPIVYAFQLPTYRKAFLTVFRCRKHSSAVHPMAEIIELQ